MARRARNWEDRSAHVAPVESFDPMDLPDEGRSESLDPIETGDPRYIAHIEGRRSVLEDCGEPFESLEAAVAWARERAPTVWVRLRGEDERRPAGEAQGALHEDPSTWVPVQTAATDATDGLMAVEVRQGFRRRSAPLTDLLISRLLALGPVEQVVRGRDVGDMHLLDRPLKAGSFGLAVPEGGRLTCAALVRVPLGQDSPLAYAQRLIDDEVQEVLRAADAPRDENDPMAQIGPEWSVRARPARRLRHFSAMDEFEQDQLVAGPDGRSALSG